MAFGTAPTSGGTGDPVTTDTLATIDGAGGTYGEAQIVKLAFGGAGDATIVKATAGLPISINGAYYLVSAVNSTAAQLVPGATFPGAVEDLRSQPGVSVLLRCDQPGILKIYQYTDVSGLVVNKTWTVYTSASADLQQAFSRTINGNYISLSFQNTGSAATTTLELNTAYGTIPATTNLGNGPVSIEEIGGMALSAGAKPAAQSIPVALATDQLATGLNVTSDQLGALIAPQSASTDVPSLNDLLNPMSEFYVPPQTQLVDQGGNPVNFQNGNLPVATATRRISDVIYAVNQSTTPIYCADMNSASLATFSATGSIVAVAEGFFPGLGWQSLFSQTVSNSTGVASTLGANVASASASATTVSFVNLAGAEWFRVRATTLSSGYIRVSGQLNQAASLSLSISALQAGAWTVTNIPATPTAFSLNSAASTNATSVKASAGTLFNINVTNNGAAVCFLKLYNKASAPTVGTDTPTLVVSVPANGVPVIVDHGSLGYRFATGIAYATTNLIADTDTTVIAAGQLKLMGSYL